MKQDRFLVGILIFVALLVVAALVLFFVRQDTRAYGPEDTPQGVLVNYVLAVQDKDFKRAYSYLAANEYKPDYNAFIQIFQYAQMDAALEIHDTQVEGNQAWIEITLHYLGSGPFDNGWSNPDTARLVKQDGNWKLVYMSTPYWGYDWYQQLPGQLKP